MKTQCVVSLFGFFLGISAWGKDVIVDCHYNTQITQTQFEARADLSVTKEGTVSGVIKYTLYNPLTPQVQESFSAQFHGALTVFAPGQNYKNQIDSYQLSKDSESKVNVFLNVGVGDAFSSRLIVDGNEYISRCVYP